MKRLLQHTTLILYLFSGMASGQVDMLPAGGSADADGIAAECSIGQVFCSQYGSSEDYNEWQGVQQPYATHCPLAACSTSLPPTLFLVYPNPALEGTPIKIEVDAVCEGGGLQIFDIGGRMIFETSLSVGWQCNSVLMSVGCYNVVYRQKKTIMQTKKLIVH